jgi:integral membrane protein
MQKLLSSSIGRLRLLSLLDGLSLILLLGVAMPLKYWGNDPTWVTHLGRIHGGLFILFVAAALIVALQKRWSLLFTAIVVVVASLVPFGALYVDMRMLARKQQEAEATTTV